MLFFDTETALIEPGLLAPPLVCVSSAEYDDAPILELAAHGVRTVGRVLDRGQLLVGHNVAFDFAVLCAYQPDYIPDVFRAYAQGRVRDTKIRQQLIDIAAGCLNFPRASGNMGYSLGGSSDNPRDKGLIYDYAGKDRTAEKTSGDAWRLRFGELIHLPLHEYPPAAVAYAIEDTLDTRTVFRGQGPDTLVNEIEQVQAAWALHLASVWGIRTDSDAVDALEKSTTEAFHALQQKMLSLGLFKVAGTKLAPKLSKNMSAIKERVVAAYALKGKHAPTTLKGNVCTDADTLDQSGDELLAELGEGGPITTILKTFVPAMKRGTQIPINSRFNPLVQSGRPSSSAPNLYNIPRKGGVRECFRPRPGFVFCSVDYDCAELRSLAQVCLWLFGKSALAEFFQTNPHGDPHLELAASILGISPEEAAARKALGDPLVTGMRQMCKAINFGLPGGMGAEALMEYARGYGVTMTLDEACERVVQWFTRWPEMRRYLKEYISRLCGGGYASVEQLRPDFVKHRIRGQVSYTEAANTYFQGLTADGAKNALFLVSQECYVDLGTPLYGSRPVIFLYDEIIAEVPEEIADLAAARMATVMRAGMQEWLPDVPVTCEPHLMTVWSKEAKAVFQGGKLVPWTPEVRVAA